MVNYSAFHWSEKARKYAESVNSDNLLNKSMITNCLTKIPQDIKLELKDGVLTLKAGSKVTFTDNTTYTPASDVTYNGVSFNGPCYIFMKNEGKFLFARAISQCMSGTETPTTIINGISQYFNVNTRKTYTWNGSAWIENFVSFPIGVVTLQSSTPYIKSLDQVLNGYGYIGKHNYLLPGVKLLISKGYNKDGSYKNQEYTINEVLVSKNSFGANTIMFFRSNIGYQIYNINKSAYLGELSSTPAVGSGFQWYYNTTERLWYMHEAGETSWRQFDYANVGVNTETETKFKEVFRAVDQNDFNKLDEEVVKTSGNQSIGGIKTFTDLSIIRRPSSIMAQHVNTTIDKTVVPSANLHIYTDFLDKNNSRLGVIGATQQANGLYGVYMQAGNQGAINILTDGTSVRTYAPTPPATDNSTKIATTACVDSKIANALPAGVVLPYGGNSAPAGYLLCNGAAVSRTTYVNLFAAIGTTYGAGNGSTTFNLPQLSDGRFIRGESTVGNVYSAGLPNITGSFNPGGNGVRGTMSGCFYQGDNAGSNSGGASDSAYVHFDASRSSSIFGRSSTVMPQSVSMRYYIKY